MNQYSQAMGILTDASGNVITDNAYSGIGDGLNKPVFQDVPDVGPIPQGSYTIEPPCDDDVTGPYSMHLVPDQSNDMFGRADFLIHGDTQAQDHTASHGCIVCNLLARQALWNTGDNRLLVTA